MSVRLGQFLKNRSEMPQFQLHGPQYQAECNWCGEMLDVYDTETEARGSFIDHDCLVVLPSSHFKIDT